MDINLADIGLRIAHHRQRLGWSTDKLAKKIGKSLATISRIENNKQAVSLHLLIGIAKALRVHPFSLLTDDPLMISELAALDNDGDPIPGPLAKVLQFSREAKKLPIEAAAEGIDVGQDELQALEYGLAVPKPESLPRIAAIYGLDLADLTELASLAGNSPELHERLGRLQRHAVRLSQEMKAAGEVAMAARVGELPHLLVMPSTKRRRGLEEDIPEYFRLSHLSNRLLRALQDRSFYDQCENMAAKWDKKNHRNPASVEPRPQRPLSSSLLGPLPAPASLLGAAKDSARPPADKMVADAFDPIIEAVKPDTPPSSIPPTTLPASDMGDKARSKLYVTPFDPGPTNRLGRGPIPEEGANAVLRDGIADAAHHEDEGDEAE